MTPEERNRYQKALAALRRLAIKAGTWKEGDNPFDVPTPTGQPVDEWWTGLTRNEQTEFLNDNI